jgi:hypothetical protein
VAVAARDETHVAVLAVANGVVYATEGDGTAAGFSAWAPAGSPSMSFSSVTALAHNASVVDALAFTPSNDHVYDVSRTYDAGSADWSPWLRIGDPINRFPDASLVSAASRLVQQVDVFVVGSDQRVWTNFRKDDENDGGWFGWYSVCDGAEALQKSRIVALAQTATQRLHLFFLMADGGVAGCPYDPNANSWTLWQPLVGGCDGPQGVTGAEAFYGGQGAVVTAVDAHGGAWFTQGPLPQ